jgi:signal transduction histidine kinase
MCAFRGGSFRSGHLRGSLMQFALLNPAGGSSPRRGLRKWLSARLDVGGEDRRRSGEFQAAVAHEMRNSLSALTGAMHLLLKEEASTPQATRALEIIQRQVQLMQRLVSDLLDVSWLEGGRITLHRERTDLRTLAAYAANAVSESVQARMQVLEVIAPEQPVWIYADAMRIEQVMLNLLVNANTYTNHGGQITLHIEVDAGTAVVRVRDTGTGIAPAVLPTLFELFTQADDQSRGARGGYGIGLALVRTLVECHGGTVCAASAGVGRGSEFTVRIPTFASSRP